MIRAMARVQPWNPTPPQQEAALSLCDSSVGGSVRSHADGTAELRTVATGEFRRYVIRADGTATLVESRPRTRRYAWSIALAWLGILLAFGSVIPVVFLKMDDSWAAMMVVVGVVVFVVGGALQPHGKPPPGERWTVIGTPEE
jgi:hypothetical protein